jgi:hypothetical protein
MKTYKEIMDEAKQTKLLNSYGYKGPFKGVDGHNTFIRDNVTSILIDLGGNEWHLMTDGVVQIVGKLDNDSLKDFLSGKPFVSEDKELEKAKIYEPGEGSQSISGEK